MRALIVILIVCLLPMQLAGQTTPAIDAGARIRVRTPEMRNVAGRVEALTSDTLVLQPDGQTTSISIPVVSLIGIERTVAASRMRPRGPHQSCLLSHEMQQWGERS